MDGAGPVLAISLQQRQPGRSNISSLGEVKSSLKPGRRYSINRPDCLKSAYRAGDERKGSPSRYDVRSQLGNSMDERYVLRPDLHLHPYMHI